MSISIIAAVGRNLELGKKNDLIWHFKQDMKFFKETTLGHTVIMGRKTFESLPKALPNRLNVVITSDKGYNAENAVVVSSVEEALKYCENDESFILGGGMIYKELLPYADKLYLTEIEDSCEDADTFFPSFDKEKYNRTVLKSLYENSIAFSHIIYEKIK